MDGFGILINAIVVASVGLILGWLGKGRVEAVDRRFDSQDQRIERLERRLEQWMDAFQASMDLMRSGLTQVALAVGLRRSATNA